MSKESKLSVETLRSLLSYDPETGVFRWISGRRKGQIAGGVSWDGYTRIHITTDGVDAIFLAHRLAWLFVYGVWPAGPVDHKDEARSHNAIGNLREATSSQNAARRRTRRTKGPSRGVYPHGAGFVARIHHEGKRIYLGYFSTSAAARAAYEAKAKEIHGDFAYVETHAVARSPGIACGALSFGA